MRVWVIGSWVVFGLLGGCGSSEGTPLPGNTACEKYDALSERVGCSSRCENDLDISEACETEAAALMDCAAQDLSQCLCESDGELNCEGASKPNEGPALCVEETAALESCEANR